MTPAGTSNELDVQNEWEENTYMMIIIDETLARSLEPVVTYCSARSIPSIHTQTQVVASRKPKEIERTHEGEANLTT